MTKRTSKQDAGTALIEEPVLDERVPDQQPDGAPRPDRSDNGRTSATQQGTQQFVTFLSGDEVFAADMSPVKEIIRVPQVVRVPLAPAALEGLANLRGKVLPIISLRRLFGFPELEHDDSTRALVIDVGQPLGFVVDRVSSVMGVDTGHIEDVGSISTTVNTEVLSGLIKDAGGHAMIMVLDFAKLIEREFSQIAAITKNSSVASAAQAQVQSEEEDSSDELQLVSFNVEGQEYAIAIEDVQEIVQVPEAVIHVPHSESHVLGVMTLRNRLLPLVRLRRIFGLPDTRPRREEPHRGADAERRLGGRGGGCGQRGTPGLKVRGGCVAGSVGPRGQSGGGYRNLPFGQWKASGLDHDCAQSLRSLCGQGGIEYSE